MVERSDKGEEDPKADREEADSFSGNERNHLFINRAGQAFDDVSPLSGLDCLEDTRSSVAFDYDRDGWLDIALVNCNAPAFGIYHNNLGSAPGAPERNNGIIAVRMVGGAKPSKAIGFAPRDGYGAKAYVRAGEKTYMRESRAGEGFAAQNSRTLVIGIGANKYAQSVEIRWPSGKTQSLPDVAAGTLLTCYEDPADSPDGSGFTSESYLRNAAEELLATGVATSSSRPILELTGKTGNVAPYRMVTTMATWCEVCKGELPQLEALRAGFRPDELAMLGAPIDVNDDPVKLAQYQDQFDPAYELLAELPADKREQIQAVVKDQFGKDTLPATLVLNAEGEVIAFFPGVPSISELRHLFASP